MPETSINTRVEEVGKHMERVRSLLALNPQRLTTIQAHLGLTKPQTLAVMERLEMHGEVFCRVGVWRLAEDE